MDGWMEDWTDERRDEWKEEKDRCSLMAECVMGVESCPANGGV